VTHGVELAVQLPRRDRFGVDHMVLRLFLHQTSTPCAFEKLTQRERHPSALLISC
jgi:hypothetical protein